MPITLTQLNDYLITICGTFRQSVPTVAVQRVILGQVGQYPAEFFEWACRRMAEMDQLPRNIGKTLSGDLWPQWRAVNPDKVSRQLQGCPDCNGRNDKPGIGFYAFRQDEYGGWETAFFACRCCRFPKGSTSQPTTKAEALGKGWSFMPDDWESGLMQWEYFLKHGKEYVPTRRCRSREMDRAMGLVGKLDPMHQDYSRFGRLSDAEMAEVFR